MLEAILSLSHSYHTQDLITPRLTPNPAFNVSAIDTDNSASRSPFICPISQVEVGHAPFAIIRTCGCVLSERALREVCLYFLHSLIIKTRQNIHIYCCCANRFHLLHACNVV